MLGDATPDGTTRAVAATLLCVVALLLAPAAGAATIHDLGTLGGVSSQATATSPHGYVAGWADLPGDGVQARHAFVWTAAGGMADLGTLGGRDSVATAVNDAGQVVGVSDVAGGDAHAFSWTPLGGMVDLGTFGGPDSEATAVNADGLVVGRADTGDEALAHAFAWTAEDGMTELVPPGGGFSSATAVNDAGQVTGFASFPGFVGGARAFLWTAADGMAGIDDDLRENSSSEARAISASGQVVGEANRRGFSWTAAGGKVDLGTLGASFTTTALDVNAAGQVVGSSTVSRTPAATNHAFLWTAAAGIADLGTLGGRHSIARAINDAGLVVGAGDLTGSRSAHAYAWRAGEGMTDLGGLTAANSEALAVDEDDRVAGWAATSGLDSRGDPARHAVYWTVPAAQQIAFTSTPPDPGIPGDAYVPAATGGGSANPVTFSIDASSTEGTCSLVAGVVLLAAPGRCVVAADQAGEGDDWLPAPTVTQTIVVAGPTLAGVPAGVVAEATGPDGASVSFDPPTATDPYDGDVAVTCTAESGATFALGATAVTCSAVDSVGVEASASFDVTVRDTTPPAIDGLAPVTVNVTSAAGTAVSWPAPTASDLVDGAVAVACAPASGSTFAPGVTTVTCSAIDAAGNAGAAGFDVSVQLVPAIVTQPVARSVYAGQTVTFAASASGVPEPTVRWQVSTDGGVTFANVPGAEQPTLSFTAETALNEARYRAVFVNDAGIAITRAVKLTVRAPTAPAITAQPRDDVTAPGTTASFHAAASGAPAPTVQWQVSTDDGASWVDVAGATAATYAFTAGGAQSGWRYRAVFANPGGTVVSASARLTVQAKPAVTTQPTAQTVAAGETATFAAAATGFPTPTVQWQKAPPGGAFADVPGATEPALAFTATLADARMRYRAVFANAAGSATTQGVRLTVTP